MKLKIEWNTFIDFAMSKIRETYPGAYAPAFMTICNSDKDCLSYDLPSYVEIPLEIEAK